MRSEREYNQQICRVKGCERAVYAKGYCNKHYTQIRAYGELRPDLERVDYSKVAKECTEGECHGKVVAKGLCMTHYQQQRRATEQADQVEANMQEEITTPKTEVHKPRRVRRRRATA